MTQRIGQPLPSAGRDLTGDDRLARGRDCFNAGDYFEAHEIWEDLWHECAAADRHFVQSLIQAAVALHHAGNGNPAGARTLLARGRAKAELYPPQWYGLDRVAFWNAVERAVNQRLAAWPESAAVLGPQWHLEPVSTREGSRHAE